MYGKKARSFLLSKRVHPSERGCRFTSVVALSETHALVDSVRGHRGELASAGYKSFWSPAEPTSNNGSHGGTMIAARQHLDVHPFVDQDQVYSGCNSFSDISVVTIRLKGMSLTIIKVYLDDNIGLTKANVWKMHRVHCITQSLSNPWFLCGDFNTTPEDFKESG